MIQPVRYIDQVVLAWDTQLYPRTCCRIFACKIIFTHNKAENNVGYVAAEKSSLYVAKSCW